MPNKLYLTQKRLNFLIKQKTKKMPEGSFCHDFISVCTGNSNTISSNSGIELSLCFMSQYFSHLFKKNIYLCQRVKLQQT